jgi:hypothetical protein
MTMSAIADALASGGTYLKWEHPGTTYTGIITDVTMRQSRKYESTDLDAWDDGTPKMQVVLTLATDYRDQGQQDDDGTRMVSINLWSGQKKALVAACKAAGVAEPQVGQRFTATHVAGIGNAKAPRVFEYTLLAAPTGVAAVLDVEPNAAPVAIAPAGATPVDTAKELLALGMSTQDVAAASGLPETVVAALANLPAPF